MIYVCELSTLFNYSKKVLILCVQEVFINIWGVNYREIGQDFLNTKYVHLISAKNVGRTLFASQQFV